jgi:hypothetical protein
MDHLLASNLQHFSRREFLRLIRNGTLALFWLPLMDRAEGAERLVTQQEIIPTLGRTLSNGLEVYNRPSFSSDLIKTYSFDQVIPITAATIGDQYPSHNRVWYLMNNEGYVHSGKIQPVALHYNAPVALIPEPGRLVEVSVPFTDAAWNPDRPAQVAHRLYYSSTYWITKIVLDKSGSPWYLILDDKRKYEYYARAEHLRPIEPQELEPISPEVMPDGKRIEVHLEEQVVIAYEGDRAVFMARTSSGAYFSDGDFRTQTGTYVTSRKRPSRHMAAGNLATSSNAYDLPGVPWVCYITESGVAFHGTYWHNDFGKPRSHGCLNLSSPAARWIYRWTLPRVPFSESLLAEETGTRVDVFE